VFFDKIGLDLPVKYLEKLDQGVNFNQPPEIQIQPRQEFFYILFHC